MWKRSFAKELGPCADSEAVLLLGWLPFFFIAGAALSAIWVTGSHSWFPKWQGFPNTASTTLLCLACVATARQGAPARYKWSIVAGLGFSAMGDAFLMAQRSYFVAGLASFLAAHLCYLWAFTHDGRLAATKLPFLVWGLWGIVLVPWLWPSVPASLRIPVVLYAAALLAMAAQAASRAASSRGAAAILAAVGAALFVVSDSVLAFQRFHHPLDWGRAAVLGTYFAAQGGIALSVVLHRDRVG
jgi:uncharacterized membrane protein YhhN